MAAAQRAPAGAEYITGRTACRLSSSRGVRPFTQSSKAEKSVWNRHVCSKPRATAGPVLEIGSYCGYSALRLALAGRAVVTLETDPIHAVIARLRGHPGDQSGRLEAPCYRAVVGLIECFPAVGTKALFGTGTW